MAGRIAPPARPPAARIAPPGDAALGAALAHGARLVESASALAFTLEDIRGIDLPDPEAAHVDRAQLRALASIYLAADLEPAGIIVSADSLASLSATGALDVDLRGAEPLVAAWWRHRQQRMSADERNAFFSRLFGAANGPASADGGPNQRFEDRMLELCEALSRIDQAGAVEAYGGTMGQVRVRVAARALAHNLGDASTGIAAFVAGEVIATLKDAFAILGHNDVRAAFHARDLWDVVRAIARLSRARLPDADPFLRRGKAGMMLLAWVADSLDAVLGSGPLVQPGDPVIGSAVDWLQATLSLGEGTGQTTPAPAPVAPDPNAASAWSSLAR